MNRAIYLFVAFSLASILGCASNPPPPPQTPAGEAAAVQALARETANPQQPAPEQ